MTAIAKMPYYDVSKVRDVAKGRWLEVFAYLAGDQLKEAFYKPGKHVTCPMHGTSGQGRGDGFRFFKDVVNTGGGICNTCGAFYHGLSLLIWLKGWDFHTTLHQVARVLQVPPEQSKRLPQNHLKPVRFASVSPIPKHLAEIQTMQVQLNERVTKGATEARDKIERTWYESISLADGVPEPLLNYWRNRCLLLRRDMMVKGDNIRFHAELPYYDKNEDGNIVLVGKFPAMIAAVRDLAGNIITLHRTYLTPSGEKAKVECPRKMMPVPEAKTVTGGAIQLGGFPTDGVLGIAEGIETAMSIMRVYRIPTWSSISATILERFKPPKGITTLLIWADRDQSMTGQRSAQALKDALEPDGLAVHILMPQRPIKGKSVDWNDVLVSEGTLGFPAWNMMKQYI